MDFDRDSLFPEEDLPDASELLRQSRRRAPDVQLGSCAFLDEHGVESEVDYKRRRVSEGKIMFQAQIGYRDVEKTARGCTEIYQTLQQAGYSLDRFGFIFDDNMDYPPDERMERPRGTGLIVRDAEELAALTRVVPVAPHFGDHMIGTPASVENVEMALAAGSTSMGNLAQYYTYDLLYEKSDIPRTVATVKGLALAAAQPIEILIHSNIEDSFAPLFSDLCCCLGMVLVEQYIVGDLIGGKVAHCYGQTFPNSLNRLAFQRALGRIAPDTGTMIVGNTSAYERDEGLSYAVLASTLTTDLIAQRLQPTLHALVPIPVTEFSRIPDIDEIATVHLFANRLNDRLESMLPMIDLEAADRVAVQLIDGGQIFKTRLLAGFEQAGIKNQRSAGAAARDQTARGQTIGNLFWPRQTQSRQMGAKRAHRPGQHHLRDRTQGRGDARRAVPGYGREHSRRRPCGLRRNHRCPRMGKVAARVGPDRCRGGAD